jgi:hypothetical protein
MSDYPVGSVVAFSKAHPIPEGWEIYAPGEGRLIRYIVRMCLDGCVPEDHIHDAFGDVVTDLYWRRHE